MANSGSGLIKHPKKFGNERRSEAAQLRREAHRNGETSDENIEQRRDQVARAIVLQKERLANFRDEHAVIVQRLQVRKNALPKDSDDERAKYDAHIDQINAEMSNAAFRLEAQIAQLEGLAITIDCLSFRYEDEENGKRRLYRKPITQMLFYLHNEMIANRNLSIILNGKELMAMGAVRPDQVELAKRELKEYLTEEHEDVGKE
jgi:hypothetical protein